jgi:hypothetical protein
LRVPARVLKLRHAREMLAAFAASEEPMLVRGMGRSYGDVAQLARGTMIDGRQRARNSVDARALSADRG